MKFDYSGTSSLILIELNDKYSNTAGLISNFNLSAFEEYLLNGIIRTTSGGTLTIQAEKYEIGSANIEIATVTKVILIRVK